MQKWTINQHQHQNIIIITVSIIIVRDSQACASFLKNTSTSSIFLFSC
jgi:hypothetical protein